jgi:hypothetical protein
MNSPFNYGWGALAVVLSLIGAWVWGYSHGQATSDQRWEAQRATEAFNHQTTERAKEHAISTQFEAIQEQSAAQLAQARADLDGANAELGRLHERLATMRDNAERADTTTSGSCQATRQASMVLSDLYQRDSKRLGEVSAAYETARLRGLTCEQAWDSLRKTFNR